MPHKTEEILYPINGSEFYFHESNISVVESKIIDAVRFTHNNIHEIVGVTSNIK